MAILRFGAVCFGGVMLLATAQRAIAQEPVPDPPAAQAPASAPAPASSDFDKLSAESKAAQPATAQQAPKDAQEVAVDPDVVLLPCPVIAPTATSAVATPAAAIPTAASPAAGTNPPTDTGTPAVTTTASGSAGVGVMADGTPCKKPPVIRYDKKGKPIKEKVKKEKPPKLVPVTVVKGALTVDGLIAKADLNFQILDLQYLYIWVPGMGTAVISNHPFAGSKLQIDALNGSLLTIKADDHQLQLAGDHDFLGGKKPKPLSLYVGIDRTFDHGSIYPEFGYGNTRKAPYNWPGTLADASPNSKAPPLPDNLKQKTQAVKMCTKNPDGTEGNCRVVEVPMVVGKKS
jgi:hypothetical protein